MRFLVPSFLSTKYQNDPTLLDLLQLSRLRGLLLQNLIFLKTLISAVQIDMSREKQLEQMACTLEGVTDEFKTYPRLVAICEQLLIANMVTTGPTGKQK